jgi:transposase
MTNRNVSAIINGSERAIRPCVIFRKVTYCFRSGWGAELYADIRSVIETGRRRAIDALEAIRLTLAGKPLAPTVPS